MSVALLLSSSIGCADLHPPIPRLRYSEAIERFPPISPEHTRLLVYGRVRGVAEIRARVRVDSTEVFDVTNSYFSFVDFRAGRYTVRITFFSAEGREKYGQRAFTLDMRDQETTYIEIDRATDADLTTLPSAGARTVSAERAAAALGDAEIFFSPPGRMLEAGPIDPFARFGGFYFDRIVPVGDGPVLLPE